MIRILDDEIADRLENALDAMGCPDARSVARLVCEVLPDLLADMQEPSRFLSQPETLRKAPSRRGW